MKKKVEKKKEPRNFILCPACKSKSKVLYSEFGGLQTRECKRGHIFEYDKWIEGRLVWGALFNPGALPAVMKGMKRLK